MAVAIGWQFTICCQREGDQLIDLLRRRRGREAEGGGLLNRYTVKSRIEGSNPSVSANLPINHLFLLINSNPALLNPRSNPCSKGGLAILLFP